MAVVSLEPHRYDEGLEALKEVMDPELGINIVDLGLIYDLGWDDEADALVIHMTLTSAGCPLTDVIEEQTAEALDSVVDAFRINWVWMPPWGQERITDDGRDMMRALGFAIYRYLAVDNRFFPDFLFSFLAFVEGKGGSDRDVERLDLGVGPNTVAFRHVVFEVEGGSSFLASEQDGYPLLQGSKLAQRYTRVGTHTDHEKSRVLEESDQFFGFGKDDGEGEHCSSPCADQTSVHAIHDAAIDEYNPGCVECSGSPDDSPDVAGKANTIQNNDVTLSVAQLMQFLGARSMGEREESGSFLSFEDCLCDIR